jgi:glycosyltransferase involved in cell wall biosynthesis
VTTHAESRKRLAVVTTSYPSDSDDVAGHFVQAEVRHELAQGHTVTVFAPAAERKAPVFVEPVVAIPHGGAFGSPGALARIAEHPSRLFGVVRYLRLARKALFTHDCDELTAHFILPSYWPIAAGHPRLTRVVIHGSDLRLLEQLPRPLRARILARLRRDNPIVQCVSQELADHLVTLAHSEQPLRIQVQPSRIDVPQLPNRRELRASLGVDERPLIVLVARLIASKRVDVALRAALHVPEAVIVVCGGGPLEQELTNTFPNVRFLGNMPRSETLKWIAAADVLLSASRTEGAPTAIREARALGVPVVTTAAGDLLIWARTDPDLHVVP